MSDFSAQSHTAHARDGEPVPRTRVLAHARHAYADNGSLLSMVPGQAGLNAAAAHRLVVDDDGDDDVINANADVVLLVAFL